MGPAPRDIPGAILPWGAQGGETRHEGRTLHFWLPASVGSLQGKAVWGLGAQSSCSDRNGSHVGTSLLGCAGSSLQTAGGKLRKLLHCGGYSVGPGETDSILCTLDQFFVFFKEWSCGSLVSLSGMCVCSRASPFTLCPVTDGPGPPPQLSPSQPQG